MAVDVRLATAALVIFAANFAFAQRDRCEYMRDIPRPPTPEPSEEEEDFSGLTWAQRSLLPTDFEPREDLCMGDWHPTAVMPTQIIYMEEEIEGDVPIAKLNYRGTPVPFVGSFLIGTFNRLGPVIRRIPEEGGDYYLVITQRQDFETPGMQQYTFHVEIQGEPTVRVALVIVNIDDNDPRIEMLEDCVILETAPMGLTNCGYNVTDADGRISTQDMRFVLESDRGDEEVFEVQGVNPPGQWFWMDMNLILTSQLNFELNALHIFRVTALDSASNNHTVTIMVRVGNVESRPPRWVEIFAMQQFNEKTTQEFTVRAIDGDTGINRPIFYRIETDPEDDFFEIATISGGRNGSTLYVSPIDRDTLEREVFHLSIIAYKTDNDEEDGNETFSITAHVVIIVNDVNDQDPEPFQPEYTIDIMEETAMQINIPNFGFHDRDLGEHAQYSVEWVAEYPEGAEAGFNIAPQIGYQRQSFIMTTANHSMLDYENEEFQAIRLKVVATDLNMTSRIGVAYVNINLINWNDEEPIFENDVQTARFRETEGTGFHVADVIAEDRDIGDKVVYQLLGNVGRFLSINETGSIFVTADDAFDYHVQSELFIQVRADDTLGDGPYHTATSQLVIQLEDVNNTPPTLRLPRTRPEIEENVPINTLISEEIIATDPDTTAELVFEIDWESSYATKQGRETPAREFHNCAKIETIYPTPGQTGSAIGNLTVNEIREGVTIDYEEFEVLYLTIRVTDLKTEIGTKFDEATFTIIIIDMNDNAPEWVEGTLDQPFRVREVSASGVVIGSVLATDIDGPLYNQVRYTLFARNDTPDDLVDIDFFTGQLSVKLPGAIDADVPPRDNLYYTLIASDKCSAENVLDCPPDPHYFNTEGNITISIIDTNNKEPEILTELFNRTVEVWENATSGTEITYIFSRDLDRDEYYNTVSYTINYAVNPRLRDFFDVDINTGLVFVNLTTHEYLDRDGDEPRHTIFFILSDNFLRQGDGNTNQVTMEIEVILLDVNDNAPELPPPNELSWTMSENEPAGERILPEIYAPDRDEPDTDNSRVGYAILNLTVTDRDIEVPELFDMIQIENVTGELETTRHLQGYWGTYVIHILAYDHGHPQQSSNETYELVIRPYNFHHPVFVFPQPNTVIRLARERIAVNGVLFTVDNDFLERIQATDEDGLHAGRVTFQIQGDSEATSFFTVLNDGENSGQLILLSTFDDDIREFTVTIRGTDGGTEPGTLHTDCTVTLLFVPTQGEPRFSETTATVFFFEQEGGMSERFQLPVAEDRKNHGCESNCFTTYYSIIEGNTAGHFAVDPATNEIYLLKELDRSESVSHTITVAASNSPDSVNVGLNNMLTVNINVREANPRPIFERSIYTAGISVLDVIYRQLLTVHATHTEAVQITYTMDQSTMEVDPSLEAVKYSALVLNPSTGVLTLNIQPTASMHGMFEFDVVATDPSDAYDRAEVKVYLISSLNRVTFRFSNSLQEVEVHTDFIAQTFSAGFSMTCNIDQVLPATDVGGAPLDYHTDVTAHFIRNNVPVLGEEIERLRSNPVLMRPIQETLRTELLILDNIVTDVSPDPGPDHTQIITYVLIALTVVLGFMCIILLITCIVRTRTLNRRLEALSNDPIKYGSMASGLNRVAMPNANLYAAEFANPIWNETVKAPDFDAISDMSNDSDFIGIENLPQFRNDYFPPDTDLPQDTVASHDNNFRVNTTPFSPQFGNAGYRR